MLVHTWGRCFGHVDRQVVQLRVVDLRVAVDGERLSASLFLGLRCNHHLQTQKGSHEVNYPCGISSTNAIVLTFGEWAKTEAPDLAWSDPPLRDLDCAPPDMTTRSRLGGA